MHKNNYEIDHGTYQQIEAETEPAKKRGKVRAAVASCALAAMLAIGGTAAYLTAQDSVVNEFELDTNMAIDLTEPSFDSTQPMEVVPAQPVAKDPTVTNTGTVEQYAIVQVKIPVFTGSVAGEDGKSVDVVDHDLYTFVANEGWEQLGEAAVEDGYRTYTYGYTDSLAGSDSATLFDSVTVANLTKSIELGSYDIPVNAYAIQKQGMADVSAAWAAYQAQEVAAATDTTD